LGKGKRFRLENIENFFFWEERREATVVATGRPPRCRERLSNQNQNRKGWSVSQTDKKWVRDNRRQATRREKRA